MIFSVDEKFGLNPLQLVLDSCHVYLGSKTKMSLARSLDHKGSPLDGVHQNVATLEEGIVAPSSDKLETTSLGLAVIFRIDIKEANFLDKLSGWVLRQGRDIENSQTSTVVALVREAVHDELVVVDSVSGTAEISGLLRFFQRADVPEIRDRVTAGSRSNCIVLIVFVIENQEFLPGGVCDPALMRIYFAASARSSSFNSDNEVLGTHMLRPRMLFVRGSWS